MGLLIVAIVTTISAFLSAFSPNYMILVILRMLVGVGASGGQVYSTWFLEFVPARLRGTWMVTYSTFWTLGTILEAVLAWVVMPRLGWRWLLALTSIPSFAVLFFYIFTVETPRYLYMEERKDNVYSLLEKMAAVNQTSLPYGMVVSDENAAPDGPNRKPASPEDPLLLSTGKNMGSSSLLVLLSSKLAKTTLLLWVVYFGNSFLYYGIILLTSKLSTGQRNCHAITMPSGNSEDNSLYKNVFVTSLAELPGLVLSAAIVDGIGRKGSLALMYMLGCIFLFPLIIHQNEVLTAVLLFGARMCFIGTFTVAGIYCPELYPTSARATGVGIANALGNIGGMISPLVVLLLVTDCNQIPAVILLEIVVILAGISVLFFPVETKGRRLVDSIAVRACDSVVLN